MNDVLRKIPIWALTLALVVLGGISSIFTMQTYVPYFNSLWDVSSNTTATVVLAVVFAGVMTAFFLRLFARLVYGVGDRLFFRAMRAVPDYNLRRLPIAYNTYVRWVLWWLCIALALACLFGGLLMYVFPMGAYMWGFLSRLAMIGCLGAAYYCMDKNNVPAWQSGKCFLCLAIPAAVLFILFEVVL